MRGIEYQCVPELDLAVLRIAHASKLAEIDRFLAAKDAEGRSRYLIVHIGEGVVGTYSIEDLKRLLMARREAVVSRRKGGHTVFVLDAESDAALIRWMKAYAEHSLQWPVQYHFAASEDEAVELVKTLAKTRR